MAAERGRSAERRDVQPSPCPKSPERPAAIGDLRFRALIGEEGWAALAPAVRARFGKSVSGGTAIVYRGIVTGCRMNPAGWLLAQFGRLLGGPLPLSRDSGTPAVVTVTEDTAAGGQFWTRVYGRRGAFPQVIHSSKRFCGRTGLEEYVGSGIAIALRVRVEDGALHFLSDHIFLAIGGRKLRLPRWASPGALTVSHVDRGDGTFDFVLTLRHPWFGELIGQTARFSDGAR